jgi:hypothetical protein
MRRGGYCLGLLADMPAPSGAKRPDPLPCRGLTVLGFHPTTPVLYHILNKSQGKNPIFLQKKQKISAVKPDKILNPKPCSKRFGHLDIMISDLFRI